LNRPGVPNGRQPDFVQHLARQVEEAAVALLEHGEQQVLCRPEVVEHRGVVHAGALADGDQPGATEARVGVEFDRRLENGPPGLLALREA
jgi:hypothetical protein